MRDEDLIKEFGLESFSKEDQDKMIQQIGENLKLRVGMKFAEIMSDEQLEQFQDVMDKDNETEATKWLATNIPNYPQLVANEIQAIKDEVHSTIKHVDES